MNYPFILKFSSVQNLSDARYAAGMWADYTGFCFDPNSADYLEPGKAKEIISWLSGSRLTGEFGHQPAEWISDFVKNFGLSAVEIPSDYPFDPSGFGCDHLLLRVADPVRTALMDKALILIAESEEVYGFLKAEGFSHVMVYANERLNLDDLEAVCFKCSKEDKPGTSNQSEWTALLEKYQDD